VRAAAIVLPILLAASPALAQTLEPETRLPIRQSERPITLSRDTIRIDTGVAITRAESPNETFAELRGGAAGGLGGFFEFGSLFAPVQVAPESRWLDPSVYARVRYFESEVELALEVEWRIPAVPGSAIALFGAAPIRWHIVPEVRLDLVPRVGVKLLGTPESEITVPLSATFSLTPTLFTGARVGLAVEDATRVFIETAIFFGGTLVGAAGPTADLRVEAGFPSISDGFVAFVVTLSAELFLFP
jgi:hypothetical protein